MKANQGRYEIILAGSGGQGLVLSGMMLAEAAILEGKNTVQTQSYGIASRGGLSLAEVIIDDREIIFQQVQEPDVVLALTEESLERYQALAGQGVPVFYDTTLARARSGANLFGHPFTRIASELGNSASVNILALGALAAACPIVKTESLEMVIRGRFRKEAAELNMKALRMGIGLVRGA
ncbi:MAG: 2-oxoacid:acceptor oxidoreductase family protein [Deltaproteobacteria bacterium]|nr:2-oxoacid:acceptor oxidoreductase family protein [Deltaproteobacteria bacterium]